MINMFIGRHQQHLHHPANLDVHPITVIPLVFSTSLPLCVKKNLFSYFFKRSLTWNVLSVSCTTISTWHLECFQHFHFYFSLPMFCIKTWFSTSSYIMCDVCFFLYSKGKLTSVLLLDFNLNMIYTENMGHFVILDDRFTFWKHWKYTVI